MATQNQKKVAKLLIENMTLDKPLNAGEVLEKVGYSKSVAIGKPKEILESQGVKDALEELGFTEFNAKKVVAQILLDPEQESASRLKAADMTFKVHGSYAPEKSVSLNIDIESNPEQKLIAQKYEEEIKGKL